MEMTSYDEMAARIGEVSAANGGTLPPDQAAAWAGYIAALLEWGNLPVPDHGRQLALLGPAAAGAVVSIFLGAVDAFAHTQPVGFATSDAERRSVARSGTHG